jgi:P-type Ca2+ transporter type 2C
VLTEIGVQILIVFAGGSAFQVTRINSKEWGISLALGAVSIPLGALVRLLPNKLFSDLFEKIGLFSAPKSTLPSTNPNADGWTNAISLVRDNLGTFAQVRGGRLRSSSFIGKSRLVTMKPEPQLSL